MFRFQLLTHEKIIFDDLIYSVIIPGKEGSFEVLKDHAPLIGVLKPGSLLITDRSKITKTWVINGGLVEVLNNQVSLLADLIEIPI